ncbi:MAG TPA: hemagglutinin protein, partial [Flavobacteriales bacterium]|nr:hemagglutinin protein [Flavobacteriales bacterium]
WVRVELRAANDPAQLIASGQFVLWSNGRLLQSNNGSEVVMKAPPGNYYVVVRHRNHLAAMTVAPVFLSSNLANATALDLTLPATATYGSNAQKNINGKMVLWPGDANFNGEVKYTGTGNDRDLILNAIGGTTPTNTVTNTYSPFDINMDGTIRYTGTNNDRDIILETIGGVVPTATRAEQLP